MSSARASQSVDGAVMEFMGGRSISGASDMVDILGFAVGAVDCALGRTLPGRRGGGLVQQLNWPGIETELGGSPNGVLGWAQDTSEAAMTQQSYRQFCPVAMAAEVLCTRWTVV